MHASARVVLHGLLLSGAVLIGGCFSLTDSEGNRANIDLLGGETTITSPRSGAVYEYDRGRARARVYDEETGTEEVFDLPANGSATRR